MKDTKPPVIAIMGPTASGKTAVALEIARHVPCEIISVDSALVYRDMDIGTAKPSREEQAAVPHHLIDIIDPAETYSVAQFRTDALSLIQKIQQRGKLPLLVGGTMLYFHALTKGLDNLPEANPDIRARLDEEAAQAGWPALHARLTELDPETAERLKPNDAQRIQRALEIIELTGIQLSTLHSSKKQTNLSFELIPFALEPSDRSKLHERIALRFDQMLENDALIEEVSRLRQRGNLHLGMPSMRCVGYRQTWQYLNGDYDRKALRDKGIAATRQLAKRQLTWLRSMPERIVIDCLSSDAPAQIMAHIRDKIGKLIISEKT